MGEAQKDDGFQEDPPAGGERRIAPREAVEQAKRRLLNEAASYDPLAAVRRHPYMGICGAFAAGYGIRRTLGLSDFLALFPAGVQIAALSAKLGLLILDKRERS